MFAHHGFVHCLTGQYLRLRLLTFGVARAPARQRLFDHRAIHRFFLPSAETLAAGVDPEHGIRQQARHALGGLGCRQPHPGRGDAWGGSKTGDELGRRGRYRLCGVQAGD